MFEALFDKTMAYTNTSDNIMEVALTTGTKLAPYRILDFNEPFALILSISLSIAAIIAILLYALIIKFILKQPAPKRPIDSMQLVDQTVQGSTFTILSFLTLAMIWSNKSIIDIFGMEGCWILAIIHPIIMWGRVVGSFGLTYFRYTFMEKQEIIQKLGVRKLMKVIWSLEALAMMTPVTISYFGSMYGRTTMIQSICKGIPMELQSTIQKSSDTDGFLGWIDMMIKAFAIPRVSLLLLEVVLNIKLFRKSRQQTDKMKKSISSKTASKRYKKNAINLRGQLINFTISTCFEIVIFINGLFGIKLGYEIFSLGIISAAFANIGTLLGSPELRREYLGADDILLPFRSNRVSH